MSRTRPARVSSPSGISLPFSMLMKERPFTSTPSFQRLSFSGSSSFASGSSSAIQVSCHVSRDQKSPRSVSVGFEPCIEQESVRAVEARQAKAVPNEVSFEVAVVSQTRQEGSGDATVVVTLEDADRGALGAGETDRPTSVDALVALEILTRLEPGSAGLPRPSAQNSMAVPDFPAPGLLQRPVIDLPSSEILPLRRAW